MDFCVDRGNIFLKEDEHSRNWDVDVSGIIEGFSFSVL